jgi:hypothetical protein
VDEDPDDPPVVTVVESRVSRVGSKVRFSVRSEPWQSTKGWLERGCRPGVDFMNLAHYKCAKIGLWAYCIRELGSNLPDKIFTVVSA